LILTIMNFVDILKVKEIIPENSIYNLNIVQFNLNIFIN